MIEVRDRLTDKISGNRLRLEIKRSTSGFIVLAGALVVALAGAAFILANVAPTLIRSDREYAFRVSEAKAVQAGVNEVRFKGIVAGRVGKVALHDGEPVVTVDLENKFGKLYRNARAEIRPNTALQDQYIDIVDRGTPSAGEASAGDPLPPSQTQVPVDIDDVLNTFDADTRTRLRILLAELGNGLQDRGVQLRNTFVQAAPLVQVAGRISHQLAVRRPMTQRLVHNIGILTAELGRRQGQLRRVVYDGSAALKTLEAGRGDLDATLRQLPPTLTVLDSSFAATRQVLPAVDTAVKSLYPTANRLSSSLAAVRRLSAGARPAVDALQTPVRRLVPTAAALVPLSRDLSTTIARLRPQIPVVDHTTLDLAHCKKGFQGFFQWDASLTKYGDSRGLVPRGNLVINASTAGLAGPDDVASKACTPGAPIGGRPARPSDEH